MTDNDPNESERNDIVDPKEDEGIEPEDVVGEDLITSPFDPTLIRVEPRIFTIDLILSRMREKEINLSPDFQRKAGIWSNQAQSRLIESILIRIPLPAFYIDATDDDQWVVVDGLQRLTTLQRFVLTEDLRLTGLEFLTQFEGKPYSELPRNFQRRILETQITTYLISRGTPEEVKFTIFRRINTGGKPLSAQEIRHALNQGKITRLLAELANAVEFQRAIANGVSDDRMEDRELVLRFLTFARISYKEYQKQDFDGFLHRSMREMNALSDSELQNLAQQFKRAMYWAAEIFDNDAFRKRYKLNARRKSINKPLFEAWAVNLHQLSDAQLQSLKRRRSRLTHAFVDLMNSDRNFDTAVSQGTGDVAKVQYRFSRIQQLIEEVLGVIHSLRLRNFKCFRDQTIELAPLTLLSGLNGMGKSSVIQALLLLRQSHGYGSTISLLLNGALVSLGLASDVLFEDADSDEIVIDLDIDMYEGFKLDNDTEEVYNHRRISLCYLYYVNQEMDVISGPDNPLLEDQAKGYGQPTAALFGPNFHYLNAERIGPRTSFSSSAYEVSQRSQIGSRGEYAAHYLAMYGNQDIPNPALAHPGAMSLSLRNQVEAWLGEISPGSRLNLNSVPDMDLVGLRFSFTKGRAESKPYRATNVGFGLTYTLPILVVALATPPGGLLLIENPEAHLHPRGQAMVGDLVARVAQGGVQVVIETHSDHILNGIRLAVHGGGQPSRLDPDNVRLHFFQRTLHENSETGELEAAHTVTSPRIDRDGRISQWPEGFFDEWDKSLEALLEPRSE